LKIVRQNIADKRIYQKEKYACRAICRTNSRRVPGSYSMKIFNKLGLDIEGRWREVDYDEAAPAEYRGYCASRTQSTVKNLGL